MRIGYVFLIACAASVANGLSDMSAYVHAEGYEKLKLVSCSQSSQVAQLSCELALDGRLDTPEMTRDPQYCSHLLEAGWWKANTEFLARFAFVRIYNRFSERQRMTKLTIYVDGLECNEYDDPELFKSKTLRCDAVGQEIKVVSPRRYMTICEIEAFGMPFLLEERLKLSKCSQSSHAYAMDLYNCDTAIDGSTANQYPGACSMLDEKVGWWKAQTKYTSMVKHVRITAFRSEDHTKRLTDLTISVDNVQCAAYKSDVTFIAKTFTCNKQGQELKIASNKNSLQMCEVEAFGEVILKDSMLKLSSCKQSSVFNSHICDHAIDGSTAQGKFAHVFPNDHGWWMATTVAKAMISFVRIYNRDLDVFLNRLNDFSILVNEKECARYHSGRNFMVKTFECGATGQELKIFSYGPSLTLCEVQAFGKLV